MQAFTPLAIALSLLSLIVPVPDSSAQEFNRENALVLAIRKVKPSIISIRVERKGSNWKEKCEGIGTGIIIDERGYAVTNRHVIAGGQRIQVTLIDQTEIQAEMVVEDRKNDLAILKLPAGKQYQPLLFGPGSDLMEGETVLAIGHPYGYTFSAVPGIISALGREINMAGDIRLTNLIQHSACINPGNSGGPLVNINGELIGINVALREGAQAIGFAINSESVKKALSQHLSAARMAKVEHGLTCTEVVQSRGPNRQKVMVEKVASNSAAAAAGLKSGDVILKLGNQEVSNGFDVERAFWSYQAGEKLEALVQRGSETTSVAFTPSGGRSPIVAASAEQVQTNSRLATTGRR